MVCWISSISIPSVFTTLFPKCFKCHMVLNWRTFLLLSLVSQWTFLLASAEWIDCIHLNLTNFWENISELLSWQISFKSFVRYLTRLCHSKISLVNLNHVKNIQYTPWLSSRIRPERGNWKLFSLRAMYWDYFCKWIINVHVKCDELTRYWPIITGFSCSQSESCDVTLVVCELDCLRISLLK